jgi:uncharacterized membrane protein YgcG
MDGGFGIRTAFRGVLMLGLLLVLVSPSLAVGDVSPQTDLALLNQERAGWGLPAGVTENSTWSSDCAAHDNYERLNGGGLTHVEQSGNPGYTAGGAYAGANSILSAGSVWSAFDNPFETAPIHLIQLFTPSLAQAGFDDSSRYVCVTTWPGMTRAAPAQETVTTYPGDGTTGFLTSEDAEESPFVPGDFVGIPEGTTAGREIFIYLDEPGQTGPAQVTIDTASLTAAGGALPIKWVDNSTGTIGPYLTGGIIIPEQPLPEGVAIDASVTVAGPNGPIAHSWTFTTAQAPHASVSVNGSSLTFTSANPAAGQLRVFVPPESNSYYIYGQSITPGTSSLDTSRLPKDTQLEACVSQPAGGGYDGAEACSQPFTITSSPGTGGVVGTGGDAGSGGGGDTGTGGGGSPGGGGSTGTGGGANPGTGPTYRYRFGLALSGRRLRVSSVPAVAFGRLISISAIYQGKSCRRHHCRVLRLASLRRTIRASARSASVMLPRVSHASSLHVTVTMAAFRIGSERIAISPARITALL